MINLDSEKEGCLWVSCAGGVAGNSYLPVRRVDASGRKVNVKVCGLVGGHSGAEIHKNRASANILMGQFLYELSHVCGYALKELEGGQQDNVITKECESGSSCASGRNFSDHFPCKENAEGFPGRIHWYR